MIIKLREITSFQFSCLLSSIFSDLFFYHKFLTKIFTTLKIFSMDIKAHGDEKIFWLGASGLSNNVNHMVSWLVKWSRLNIWKKLMLSVAFNVKYNLKRWVFRNCFESVLKVSFRAKIARKLRVPDSSKWPSNV